MGSLDFLTRSKLAHNAIAKKLLLLMHDKQSNLSVSADVTTKAQLLDLADLVGPEIAILKTHIDIITDFDHDLLVELQALAKKHQFLIFEDRKFADIGHTVYLQFTQGVYQIAAWADMVNAHPLPGPGIIEGLTKGVGDHCGLILLAEMSSRGHLMTPDYIQQTVALAQQYSDHVFGFICQHQLSDQPGMIHLTPGVQCHAQGDALGQQYRTPYQAIAEQGCDVIIVGRGILQASDPLQSARQYRQQAWDAYGSRLK